MNIRDTSSASPLSADNLVQQKESLQLRQILQALRATWRIPLVVSICLLLLAVAILVALRAAFPPTRIFISQFHFTFPSAEAGRYPNSTPFSINEILDPAILSVVYDQLKLGDYDVDRNEFYDSFSIRPFVLAESEISERFRQQLADRRLSFVERERLEQQLKFELAQASRGAAELSYIPPRRPVIPIALGRAIVDKVPMIWSQFAIEKKGALRIPGFSAATKVLDPNAIDQQPLPLSIIGLTEAGERLNERLTELMKTTEQHVDGLRYVAGVLTVRDSVSGKSIRDLERDIRNLELFHINPLRAHLVQYRFEDGGATLQQIVERRINDIEVRATALTKQAEAIGDSIGQFVQATAGLQGRPVEKKLSEGGTVAGGATIPQVGETFIDRIIQLTRRDREAEQDRIFISDRTQKQLELHQQAIALRSEQDRWKELLAQLRGAGTPREDLDTSARARMDRELRYSVAEANANWLALSRIEDEFSAKRTGRTAEIYTLYAPNRPVVSNDLILNTTVLGAVLSGLIIFFLGFWAIRAGLLLVRA
jgi:hypothetical protein